MAREGLIAAVGPLMQVAFVPSDFDAAIAHWTQVMGVGPFFHIAPAPVENVKFRGADCGADFQLAIAYWGDIQIELIMPGKAAPPIFTSAPWVRSDGTAHHICLVTEDIRKARAAVVEGGGETLLSLDVVGGGKAIYADMGGGEGLVEVLEPGPGGGALFDRMRAAAAGWDGADPLRPVGALG